MSEDATLQKNFNEINNYITNFIWSLVSKKSYDTIKGEGELSWGKPFDKSLYLDADEVRQLSEKLVDQKTHFFNEIKKLINSLAHFDTGVNFLYFKNKSSTHKNFLKKLSEHVLQNPNKPKLAIKAFINNKIDINRQDDQNVNFELLFDISLRLQQLASSCRDDEFRQRSYELIRFAFNFRFDENFNLLHADVLIIENNIKQFIISTCTTILYCFYSEPVRILTLSIFKHLFGLSAEEFQKQRKSLPRMTYKEYVNKIREYFINNKETLIKEDPNLSLIYLALDVWGDNVFEEIHNFGWGRIPKEDSLIFGSMEDLRFSIVKTLNPLWGPFVTFIKRLIYIAYSFDPRIDKITNYYNVF